MTPDDTVTRLRLAPVSGPDADDLNPQFVQTARAIAQICATRMLLLIAVMTGAVIWTWATYAPETGRLYVAMAYSLVFVLPQVFLYWRKG